MTNGVLVLGFGGPTPGCCGRKPDCRLAGGAGAEAPWPDEAACFVSGILGDNPARAARVEAVAGHYRHLGGFSAYTPRTLAQAAALEAELARRGRPMPVACGFRHWRPWIRDGIAELAARGCTRMTLLVMAPHQSSVSWDWYLKAAAEALPTVPGAPAIAGVVQPWFEHPGLVAAVAARVRAATAGWSPERFAAAELIFTAHAIPQPVEQSSPYRRQIETTARLAAEALGHPAHRVAFQSAPDDSRIPWSSPTIEQALTDAKAAGRSDAVVQAVGFLVDHTEVVWDLDHDAADHARAIGIGFTRAGCVDDHPDFIAALAERVLAVG
ncbi:MAG: hypothetical protein RLZZ127_3201 [Planctomycetota bacterium]|jgi:ferrochelatase